MALLECVPNVSEGRHPGHVDALAAAAGGVDGARLVDVSSDAAHHRTVLTLVGEADALVEAVSRLAESARRIVDLRRHRGVHPRLGAIDIVPFVPLAGSRMDAAVETARHAAKRLGELGFPVFLYGRAAHREALRRPATLRRLGLDRLAARIDDDEWRPDFGPARVDPARGVVLVGARDFLVAFNVFLDTDDVGVARTIARGLRASNGGLAGVEALGFAHPRGAQVSTNLLAPEVTSMGAVAAEVERAARRLGTRVAALEVVGLVPKSAAERAIDDGLDPAVVEGRVLEERAS